jgi:hypothetical protein
VIKQGTRQELTVLSQFVIEHKGITLEELLKRHPGFKPVTANEFGVAVKRYLLVEDFKRTATVVWSQEQILASVQKAAIYHFPLAKDDYDQLIKSGEIKGPSSALIMKRLGYWSRACALAGVESHAASDHYTKKWSIEEQLDFLRQFMLADGIGSSIAFYNEWHKFVNPHAPSAQLLRNTFEGWQPAIQSVLRIFRTEWDDPEVIGK